jgi:hypothetical protein
MGLCGGFPGADFSPGLKGFKKLFFYKGFPFLYFAGKML